MAFHDILPYIDRFVQKRLLRTRPLIYRDRVKNNNLKLLYKRKNTNKTYTPCRRCGLETTGRKSSECHNSMSSR